ncbi:MAG: thioredoxin-disulfide reductase [Microvirga sp.]
MRQVIIIGSGPAGYTAAIYAGRAQLKPLLIASSVEAGGELMNTTEVENFPGFPEGIMGPDLMENMRLQAERFDTDIVLEDVTAVELDGDVKRVHVGEGKSHKVYEALTVIVASGSAYRRLGVTGEDRLSGHGVSWCATCDGFFFRGKEVVVVGGGNTAVEEALYLANLAAKVTIVHRRDAFRAERILQDRLFRHPKIAVVWDSAVEEVLGGDAPPSVTHVRLRNLKSGGLSEIRTDGVFVAIGHKPATELFAGQLDMKPGGYLLTRPGTTETNIPGVFAAGDVADDVYRQAVTAAGLGCMAALEAERYLAAEDMTRQAAE